MKNAPVDKSINAMTKSNELKRKLLLHSPYSPHLAPSVYFPFQTWKIGQRFANSENVEYVCDDYVEELDDSHLKPGIDAIEHRRETCIELKRDYVEN